MKTVWGVLIARTCAQFFAMAGEATKPKPGEAAPPLGLETRKHWGRVLSFGQTGLTREQAPNPLGNGVATLELIGSSSAHTQRDRAVPADGWSTGM